MAGCLLFTKLVFSFELSAAGAKRGVRSFKRELYPLDMPPRPSRPKAGLGLVMMMIYI